MRQRRRAEGHDAESQTLLDCAKSGGVLAEVASVLSKFLPERYPEREAALPAQILWRPLSPLAPTGAHLDYIVIGADFHLSQESSSWAAARILFTQI